MEVNPRVFSVDEELLREAVLKAYHEERRGDETTRRALAAVRLFLSGAPGARTAEGYWFLEDPPASSRSLVVDMEKTRPVLSRHVLEPILFHCDSVAAQGRKEIADNLAVYLSSLAGAVAVKAELGEALACGLIASVLIGVAFVGTADFHAALKDEKLEVEDDSREGQSG
jgi:hypothetical protein